MEWRAIWHYSATVEVTLKDAFNNDYEMDLLPRAEIEELLDEMDVDEVVQCGIDAHITGHGTTTVSMDCETGKITASCHSCGSGFILGAELLDIMTIGQYEIRDCADGCADADMIEWYCSDDEFEAYKKAYTETCDEDGDYGNHEEACEAAEINWDEVLEKHYFEECTNNADSWKDPFDETLEDWLDAIYENKGRLEY